MNKLTKSSKKHKKALADLEKQLLSIVDGTSIKQGDNDLFPLKHSFAHGIYVREMKMKKETFVIGKIHKEDHIWFLLSGHLIIATENGTEEYIAPCYVKAPAGSKRAIYALEKSIWVNVHTNPSNTEDLEILEKEIIAKNYLEYEKFKQLKQ
tara:strand:- start:6404 stop:6859 length:456 start_codon:yes stop_codon:yes gene_type:complete